jgi:hypothetical protein
MLYLRVGRAVVLRSAPNNRGTVIDYQEFDAHCNPKAYPFLVEWSDGAQSWHKAHELDNEPLFEGAGPIGMRLRFLAGHDRASAVAARLL